MKSEILEQQINLLGHEIQEENFVTKSWTHMMKKYKDDIQCLKIKIKRWKDLMKNKKIEKIDLDKNYDKLLRKHSKLTGQLRKLREEAPNKDSSMDALLNEEIEDEMSIYEDKILLQEIAAQEEELEKTQINNLNIQRQKAALKEQERLNVLEEKEREAIEKKKRELWIYQREVDSLLRVMQIKDPREISKRYFEV